MTIPDRAITIKELTKILNLSDRKIRDLIARPKNSKDYLPSHRLGAKVVFYPEELKEWLSQR